MIEYASIIGFFTPGGFELIIVIGGVTLFILLLIFRKRHDLLISYDSPEAKANAFKPFSIIVLIALHYLTFGVFSMIWLCLAHGSMPKIRRDDPSAAEAILSYLIPFYNIYWVFFNQIRLCHRINEQRRMRELPEKRLKEFAMAMCTITLLCVFAVVVDRNDVYSGLFLLYYIIVAPVYLGLVQHAINQLAIITYMEGLADSASQQGNGQ